MHLAFPGEIRYNIEKFKRVASNSDTSGFYEKTNKDSDSSKNEAEASAFDKSTLSPDQLIIYDGMEYDKLYTVDALLEIGSSAQEISSLIMMLQLAGAIENVPGGYYIKK